MTELEWQSLFLLAAAFFVGAVVACGLKRRFYYRTGAATGANDTAQPVQAAAAPNTEQPKVEVSEPPAPAPQAAPSSANFIPVAQPKVEPIVAPEPASFIPVARPKAEPTAAEPAPPPVAPLPAPVATAAQPAPSPEPAPPVADPAPPSAPAAAPAAKSEPTPLRPVAERADVSGLRSVRSQALRGAGESVAATKDPDRKSVV